MALGTSDRPEPIYQPDLEPNRNRKQTWAETGTGTETEMSREPLQGQGLQGRQNMNYCSIVTFCVSVFRGSPVYLENHCFRVDEETFWYDMFFSFFQRLTCGNDCTKNGNDRVVVKFIQSRGSRYSRRIIERIQTNIKRSRDNDVTRLWYLRNKLICQQVHLG